MSVINIEIVYSCILGSSLQSDWLEHGVHGDFVCDSNFQKQLDRT